MDHFDLGTVLDVATLWSAIRTSAVWQLFVGIGVIVAFLWKAFGWISSKIRAGRAAKMAETLAATTHVQSFTDEEIRAAVRHYVEPDCSSVDPTNEIDLRHFIGVREPVFAAIERALSTEGKQHLLVLADSGMGKTTFLLNFFDRELERPKSSRREIAIVPLGRPDSLDQIKSVQNKRSTLLLLDALDEDSEAIKDYRVRLDDLMRVSADFKALILTCRTQFFSNDQDIPTETGILRVTPRRAGTTASHEFRKVYLVPFTGKQIQRYIRNVIPWLRPFRRRHAASIVKKIPELSIRPMLLALLPDLIVDRSTIRELWQLYEFMVDSWLHRESTWINPEQLKRLSMGIAVDLVLNRDARGGERISPTELEKNMALASEEIEQWKLTTRSLLNRDAAGNFKFAHRSIMEFLFIKAFIEGESKCASLAWTDMMCDLFLSWGRVATTSSDIEKVDRLLLHTDLSQTKLFPIIEPDMPASTVDTSWAKLTLIQTHSARKLAGIPNGWISRTSRCHVHSSMVSVYEFTEGIVWRFPDTNRITQYEEREVYKDSVHQRCTNGEWRDPTLGEFHLLVRTLVALKRYELDDRDLYWLADEGQTNASAARVRWDSSGADKNNLEKSQPIQFPGGAELIYSSNERNLESNYIIDVYIVPKVRIVYGAAGKVLPTRALRIKTVCGDAQDIWKQDNLAAGSNIAVSETLIP